MKRFLGKILGIFSILIIGFQHFCYADVIASPTEILFPVALPFLIGFIFVIGLIISAISFFSIKATVKKQNLPESESKKSKILSPEEIEKKKNKIHNFVYICVMILATIGLIHLVDIPEGILTILFFLPLVLFAISLIERYEENDIKVSNMLCGIAVVLVCLLGIIVGISNRIIKNYNNQFLQYIKSEYAREGNQEYVRDVNNLINTTINNNNNNKRKTILIYEGTEYSSPNELRQLLTKININKSYALKILYDKHYIKYITLTPYISTSLKESRMELEGYEGKQRGYSIMQLIDDAEILVRIKNIKIIIVYISETGQKTMVNWNPNSITDDDAWKIENKIRTSKTYNVEFADVSSDTFNIIITCIN